MKGFESPGQELLRHTVVAHLPKDPLVGRPLCNPLPVSGDLCFALNQYNMAKVMKCHFCDYVTFVSRLVVDSPCLFDDISGHGEAHMEETDCLAWFSSVSLNNCEGPPSSCALLWDQQCVCYD